MKKKEVIFLLALIGLLAFSLSPFVSPSPDGLERVAKDKSFLGRATAKPAWASPLAGYLWPGIRNEKLSTSLAAVSGTLFVFLLSYALARLVKKKLK
jgi:hypothetical protein